MQKDFQKLSNVIEYVMSTTRQAMFCVTFWGILKMADFVCKDLFLLLIQLSKQYDQLD